MTREEFCNRFWSYYIALENDFLTTQRYVAFNYGDNLEYDNQDHADKGNSECYSIEFVKQYQAICSEIDVILKSMCSEFCGDKTADNICKYAAAIIKNFPNIVNQKVEMNKLELQPFINWSETNSPVWWKNYNDVKHNRLGNYRNANLKNVTYSLAALYILELYYVKIIGDRDGVEDVPNDISHIFSLLNFSTREIVIGKNQYLITEQDIDKMFE